MPFISCNFRHTITILSIGFIGFILGSAFLKFYYPVIFNSDSAAHYILAETILDEGNILPKGYMYGNQLLIFRNHLFIAPFLLAGLSGYKSYALGSSLAFSIYFVLSYIAINSMAKSFTIATIISILLFIPFGYEESDFILGQQSHLSNAVFSLIITIYSYNALINNSQKYLLITSTFIFLMSLESPLRCLFLLTPMAITAIYITKAFALHSASKFFFSGSAAFVSGLIVNKLLVNSHLVFGIPAPALSTSEVFLNRLLGLAKKLIDSFFGFEEFSSKLATIDNIIFYCSKTLLLISFILLFCYWLIHVAIVSRLKHSNPSYSIKKFDDQSYYITSIAFTGAIFGFWLVSSVGHDVDVRHFLGALFLIKFSLFYMAVTLIRRSKKSIHCKFFLLIMIVILSSSPISYFLGSERHLSLNKSIDNHLDWGFLNKLRRIMIKHGITEVYGTHWNSLLLNVLIPSTKAAVLWPSEHEVKFATWLNKSSRRCVTGDVIYVVGSDGTERILANNILQKEGKLIDRSGTKEIYISQPIWDRSGCFE